MNTKQSNVQRMPLAASLDGNPTENQLKDQQYCNDLVRLAAHQGLVYNDHKGKADQAGESLSKGLWLATQGYFLRQEIPADAATNIDVWKVWVSDADPIKGNHAAKLVKMFDKLAENLIRTEPSKFSRAFFEGDKSKRGASSYWKQRISAIHTAIIDGVNPIERDRNYQFVCRSIDDARKMRTQLKESAKAKALESATVQDYYDAIATPEGKRDAIAKAVGESIQQLLLRTADVEEALYILDQCKVVKTLATTLNSQRKASLPDSARDAALDEFNRKLEEIKSFTQADVDSAKAAAAATKASIHAMKSGLIDDDQDDGEMLPESPTSDQLTPTEAYDYGVASFESGDRFADADKPDFATMEYTMFVKGYRQAALVWLNHPANGADCPRRDDVMEDTALAGKALR